MQDSMDMEGLSLHAPQVEDLSDWSVEMLARELDRIRTRLSGREDSVRLEMEWVEEDKQAIGRIEAELEKRNDNSQH